VKRTAYAEDETLQEAVTRSLIEYLRGNKVVVSQKDEDAWLVYVGVPDVN